jgi:hypothetical protein
MKKQRWIATSLALAVIAAAWLAVAQAALAQSRDALVEKYTPLAGSKDNSGKLVDGLRNGADFTIGSIKFDPPTGKLGYGEVNISLSLAKASLENRGIANPSAAQLQSALIGDPRNPGVLQMRAEHKGWGQIAQSMGMKLGEVMRNPKADRPERMARQERPERPAKPERPERPEKPERPGR